MRAAVADLASAGFQQPAERAGEVGRVVGSPPQGAEPQIPVQVRGRRCIGLAQTADGILVVPAGDPIHLAHDPVADGAACVPRAPTGPALGTHLHLAVVLAGRRHHGPPLAHRDGGGLLDVHVLARFAGMHGLYGVPVIRSGDHDRINILRRQMWR